MTAALDAQNGTRDAVCWRVYPVEQNIWMAQLLPQIRSRLAQT